MLIAGLTKIADPGGLVGPALCAIIKSLAFHPVLLPGRHMPCSVELGDSLIDKVPSLVDKFLIKAPYFGLGPSMEIYSLSLWMESSPFFVLPRYAS